MIWRYLLQPFVVRQIVALALVACCGSGSLAVAQDEDDEFSQFRPGLIAEYTAAGAAPQRRVDDLLAFDWGAKAPDPRMLPGAYSATWRGRLMSIVSGEYRLRVFAAGEVSVTLAGKALLRASSAEPVWMDCRPIELRYGFHALEVKFRKTSDRARVALFWEGPKFLLEPVPARNLFHDAGEADDVSFRRGESLAHALRCAACHTIPGFDPPRPAAALTHLRGAVSREWLIDWLAAAHQSPHPAAGAQTREPMRRRMPVFGMTRQEAQAIAAYLFVASQPPPPRPRPASQGKPIRKGKKTIKPRAADARIGRELLRTTGCLACHRVGGLGTAGLFDGGDLSRVGDKRPADFFALWLSDPGKLNAQHRMPVFKLSPQERDDLAEYLATLRELDTTTDASPRAPERPADEAIARQGKELLARFRCQSCHQLPGQKAAIQLAKRTAVDKASHWDRGCLGKPDTKRNRPGYGVSPADAQAVRAFISNLPRDSKPSALDGRQILAQRNCLACHLRGHSPGIAGRLDEVLAAEPALAPLLPGMKPPALIGVGDKLHEAALRDAILTKHAPLRPWLSIRMPKFALSEQEMQALVAYFVDSDRIPPRPEPAQEPVEPTPSVAQIAGARLVTSAGFGCTSCHQINNAAPGKVELKSRGPDLGDLGRRIRRGWYDRWMPNPSRIVPRMEMPALVQPIHGLLNDDLQLQLAAVWSVLNTPGFDPPQPNPIRVARSRNVGATPEPASVLTDVVEAGKQVYLKPFLVGLSNRHNVLLDLRTDALSGWWIGDTARQRTRGKSWYWEAGGANLLQRDSGDAELSLRRAGKDIQPAFVGQFRTEFDRFEKIPGGVRFERRLSFAADVLRVRESWTAAGETGSSGFRRLVEVTGVPPGATVRLRLTPAATPTVLADQGRELRLTAAPGVCRVRLIEPADAKIGRDGVVSLHAKNAASLRANGREAARCVVEYLTSLPVDRFPVLPPEPPVPPAQPLSVVPGFDAVRLPLPNFIMPTGLAWREDGDLVVASLKGRVWLVRDTDGDGLEDRLQQFSDELATPYGVSAHDGFVDVLNKYALLRLWDDDGDGRADRTQMVASGWGHTTDYHDWAVGLPRDKDGNYYVAIPCQQDDRDPAAAALRGKALKLTPRSPTPEDPRVFGIEEICGGLRFPMGIARDRQGNLFTTDNQGNYNPFNELNHLRRGLRYGFINKAEFSPDFHPPLTPPAIDIPHPWTRSVNGIAFLTTPAAVREELGRDVFGPFEGHLIGCEYNGRSLIRMSLQKVGDTFQGAAYPFSVDPPAGGEGFLGPNVCAVSPRGELYVGDLRDSAWGGGDNTGAVARLKFRGDPPAGIAEVRANATGFTIAFTQPVSAKAAADPANYTIASYRRVSTPAYGGADKNREIETIRSIKISRDKRQARIILERLREGFVYEFRLQNLTTDGGMFHPAEAHYTLRKSPR